MKSLHQRGNAPVLDLHHPTVRGSTYRRLLGTGSSYPGAGDVSVTVGKEECMEYTVSNNCYHPQTFSQSHVNSTTSDEFCLKEERK